MKTIYLIAPMFLVLLTGCKKTKTYDMHDVLVTPRMMFTESNSPFVGLLAVYPCQSNSSIYYGNYNNDKLSPIYANYLVAKGSITQGNPELMLPDGQYNLIYWGISKAITQAYEDPAVVDPPMRIGADTKDLYYALRPNLGDTTYIPTFDYVFNSKQTQIGSQDINVELNRVVAGLEVIVQSANKQPLDQTITNIDIIVSNVAGRLNLYDANASDYTKSVKFPLTIAQNRMRATNNMVTIFPTIVKPNFAIIATLQNGQKKIYRTTINNILSAGTLVKITVNIGEILTEESSGSGFTVNAWQEESETINTGSL